MSPPDNPLQLPAHIKAMPEDEKRARKAWLKQKFASFEYHEELVRMHEQWRNVLRRALNRALTDAQWQQQCPGEAAVAKNFAQTAMPLIEAKPKPGDYKRELWDKYYASGLFRSIPDYNRYLVSEGDFLSWLTPDEHLELGRYWGPMDQMATNIRRTVDETWGKNDDDILLDERFTGPIDWPANWREEVDLPGDARPRPPSTPAGQPCPRTGWWFTPAKATGRRRFFKQGEVMPDFPSDRGQVIWQWDERQEA